MLVTAIYAGVNDYSYKLNYVFNIFKSTCNELGVKVEDININQLNIDYFSGKKLTIIENIFNNIKNSSAVLFVCTAKLFAPCGAMQSFLEHFDSTLYSNVLQGKSCYTIITSFDGSEFNAGNYMTTVINSLGGNSIGNMLVGNSYLDNIESSLEITKMIERYAEDFYRLIKQNRKLFQFKPTTNFNFTVKESIDNTLKSNELSLESGVNQIESQVQKNGKIIKNLNGKQVANLYQKEIENKSESNYFSKENININSKKSFYSNIDNDYLNSIQSFNSYQDDDINEITKRLTNQYKNSFDTFNIDTFNNEKMLNGGTCKQKTQSLYHYFQPQIAKDMDITIQINITGDEKFNGFFKIQNGECSYLEGIAPLPEVSIIADSKVWEDVLASKYTLQKAFMLGKIKVKGNFVIISKFEQIFKLV